MKLRLTSLVAAAALAGSPLLDAVPSALALGAASNGSTSDSATSHLNNVAGAVPRSAIDLPPSSGRSGENAGGIGPTEGIGDRPVFVRPTRPTNVTPLNSKWTATSRAYANPDGSYTTDFYPDRVNYQSAAGVWTPIDTSLVPLKNSIYDWTVAANDVTVSLSDTNASVAAAQISSSGYTFRLRIPGYGAATSAASSPPPSPTPTASAIPSPAATELPTPAVTPTGSAVPSPVGTQLPSITPAPEPSASPSPSSAPTPPPPTDLVFVGASGGDVSVAPTSNGFDFGATLSTSTDPNVYAYALDLGNLLAAVDPNGQSVTVSDATTSRPGGESGATVVGHIDSPGLTDAAGLGAVSSNLSVALVRPGDAAFPAGVDPATVAGLSPTEILLVYTIDRGWLDDSLRTYPVKLDPVVCIQNTSGCTSGEFSTFVMSGQPTVWQVGWTIDRVGVDNRGTSYGLMRNLMYFPNVALGTSGTSDGAQITSATLTLHQTNNYGTTSTQFAAYHVRETWDTHATWNNQPLASGATSAVSACATSCSQDLNVTGFTREWYTRRAADWYPELGFEIRLTDEAKPEVDFDNNTTSTTTNRPKLSITYVVPAVGFDFPPSLGPNYAPSSMPAGQVTNLPIILSNNSSVTFNYTNDADLWRYQVGYRWFDAKGNLVGSGGSQDLPASVGPGATSGTILLAVTAPATSAQGTLRVELVHAYNGAATLWASDWATPSLYYERDKRSVDPGNTRWVGGSVIERDEFPMSVLAGGGTAVGDVKSVALGDGSSIGLNLWSRDATYVGSGGVGFDDLLPIELTYGYDEAWRNDCTGVVAACGWSTNFDERITTPTGANPGDYTYRAPDGNRYLVGTDGNGQLISGSPVSLQRPSFTLFDDNYLHFSSQPAFDSTTKVQGLYSDRISSAAATTAPLAPTVPLNTYQTLAFQAKTSSSAIPGAIALQIKDETTATSLWFGYSFGTYTISGMDWQANLTGTAPTSWTAFSRNVYVDAVAQRSLFGTGYTGHDAYDVIAVNLIGGGGSGSVWYDAAALRATASTAFDESLPAFSSGGSSASLSSSDYTVGTHSIAVSPVSVASSPTNTTTSIGLVADPFMRWYWKKVGGTTIAVQFKVTDVSAGPHLNATGYITYYAGTDIGYASDASHKAIQVAATIPESWTPVTRDLEDDARQMLGWFNNDDITSSSTNPDQGPTPDQMNWIGYTIVSYDGSQGLFDDLYTASGSGVDPILSPTPAGAVAEDFVATESSGVQHYFNRDGLLERVVDRDNHAETIDWTYDTTTGTGGPSAYTLQTIHAPSDGQSLSGGTAQREIAVSYATGKMTFTEQLGSTTSFTGRYTEFDRTGTDLTTVVPARWDAACATGSSPQGCLSFTYTDTSNHYLKQVLDPRHTASNGFSTRIDYTPSTGGDPLSVTDESNGELMLRVLSYADTRYADTYQRVVWQDRAGLAANAAPAEDLTPEGSAVQTYQPKVCAGTCSTGNLPAFEFSPDLATTVQFDGLTRATSQVAFRTANGPQVVSRRGTFAALGVDNLNDPLSAAESAWTQSPDQYFASVAAGNDLLYRTTYVSNSLHEPVDETTPAANPHPTPYSSQVLATSGLTGYYHLGETSGSTATDSSSGGHTGTISATGVTLNQPGALVGDANRSMLLNGSTGRITSATGVPTTAYTIAAWVNEQSTYTSGQKGIAGRWNAYSGAMLYLNAGHPYLIHGSTAVVAPAALAADRWHFLVGTWDGAQLRLYLDGQLVDSADLATAPGAGGTNFEIGSYGNGNAVTFNNALIDEVSVSNVALSPSAITALYRAGDAFVGRDVRTAYDALGHPTVRWDNGYLANTDFEAGSTGWTLTSGATVTTTPAQVHGGVRALQLTGTGTATQTAQLLGGQTARFQFWGLTASGASVGYQLKYYDTGTASWTTIPLSPATLTAPTYTSAAWDITIPTTGDGRVQVTFSNGTGAGTADVDDVGLFTTYSQAAYSTSGITGLLTDTYSSNIKSDGTSTNALIDTHLGYAAGTALPAILPLSSTAHYVTGTYSATVPDQDLKTQTAYDTWGRVTSTTDPDGVATTTTYQTNKTDIASTADGLGHATTYLTDQVGNRTSVSTPKSEATTTTYDLAGHPLTVIGPSPFSVKTLSGYTFGELTSSVANDIDGTPSGVTGADDVKTTTTYDALGYPTSTIVDDGAGMIQSKTTMTNDLLGNAITTTRYSDTAHTKARTTTAAFDQAGSPPITRPKPSGSQGPINPTAGHLCGGSLSGYCNSAVVLDLSGQAVTSYDAYGISTAHVFDLDGNEVKTVADVVTGTYSATYPDQDVTTTKTFDLAGDLDSQTDTLGHVTTALYDAVGRKTKTIAPDSAWTETGYTAGGRVDVMSRTTDSTIVDTDPSVAWTKSLYDAAGRTTATLAHYDRPALGAQPKQQLVLSSFEDGLDGWSGAATTYFTTTAGTLALDGTSPTTGQQLLHVTTNASLGGAALALAGVIQASHTYRLHATVTATSGKTFGLYLGQDLSGGSYGSTTAVGDGTAHGIDVTWTAGSGFTSGIKAAVRSESGQGSVEVYLDDVTIWDAGSADRNIPSLTVYDADSHPVESVLPGGHAGDAPLVTLTAYDSLGRATDVTVNDIAGAGTGATDMNLVTHSDYDNLGRLVDKIGPMSLKTSYVYDRLGDITSTIENDTGSSWSSSFPDRNVLSTYAYDALGELTGTCTARNLENGLTCNPSTGTDVKAWKDAYDAAGHLVSETPPTETSSITQLGRTLWTYGAGGRLTETCDVTITTSACSSSTRYQDTTYDKLGRPTIVKAYTGAAGSGTLRLQTTTTYLGDGFRSKSAFDGSGSSPSEGTDTIDFTEDALGRVATMKRGATTLSAYTYFADGTPKTRTDESGIITTFTEDWAGRPTSTSAASIASIAPAQTYRLDGLLDGRTWSTTNAVATLAYDGAKRPTSLGVAGTGIASVSLTQAYDRAGDVTSEGRTLAGISGNAGTGSQSFTYDGLRRVASATLGGTTTLYGYDGDGNRTTVVVGATTTTYTYDTTDELVSVSGGITGSFAFDAYGNMTANAETSTAGATSYAYDTADRLLTIGPPGTVAKTAGFTYDALGRPLTRNVATTPNATVDTYSYAGTGKVVSRISTKVGTGTAVPLDGLVGADGSRLATNQNSGAAFGWDLPDLHGSVAAITSSSLGTITDAVRYDAFGQVAASVTSGLPTPWRYQGRLLVDPAGATDLYDAGARFYAPGLGTFTQEDTVTGSAQDPLSMNRFLYAEANPTTLVDPDGHCAVFLFAAGPIGEFVGAATCLDVAAWAVLTAGSWLAGQAVGHVIVAAEDKIAQTPTISQVRGDPTKWPWTLPKPFDQRRDAWRIPFTKNPDAPEPGDRPPFRFCGPSGCPKWVKPAAFVAATVGATIACYEDGICHSTFIPMVRPSRRRPAQQPPKGVSWESWRPVVRDQRVFF
jgi:RHS repeat-associated protein